MRLSWVLSRRQLELYPAQPTVDDDSCSWARLENCPGTVRPVCRSQTHTEAVVFYLATVPPSMTKTRTTTNNEYINSIYWTSLLSINKYFLIIPNSNLSKYGTDNYFIVVVPDYYNKILFHKSPVLSCTSLVTKLIFISLLFLI